MSAVVQKACTGCGNTYPQTTEFFYTRGLKKDGSPKFQSRCKACRVIQNRESDTKTGNGAKWQRENKDKMIAKQRKYRRAKPNAHREANMRYWAANRDYYRKLGALIARTRRKRAYDNGGKFTTSDLRRKLFNQFGLCWWCATHLGGSWHADHVVPIANGGTSDPNNIVLACGDCNRRKNSRPVAVFLALVPNQWIKTRISP